MFWSNELSLGRYTSSFASSHNRAGCHFAYNVCSPISSYLYLTHVFVCLFVISQEHTGGSSTFKSQPWGRKCWVIADLTVSPLLCKNSLKLPCHLSTSVSVRLLSWIGNWHHRTAKWPHILARGWQFILWVAYVQAALAGSHSVCLEVPLNSKGS